jgi:hypothetical protein
MERSWVIGRRVGVPEHPRNGVERNALAECQSAGGVAEIVKANVRRKPGLFE